VPNENAGKTSTPRYKKGGYEKERSRLTKKNNNAGSIHDATKRLRRGEKDTMEAILAAYQNITARQYVRNVDRLHRRWKSGNQNRKEDSSYCSKVQQLTAKLEVGSE